MAPYNMGITHNSEVSAMDSAQSNRLTQVPFENFTILRQFSRFLTFRPKVQIYIDTPEYILKTASNFTELWDAFKLRYDCFLKHLDHHFLNLGLDIDEYDYRSDHLLIINKEKKKICGTYRIRCTEFVDEFYSEDEFFLKEFLKTSETKIELGRACVHEDYRNGATINLLWKGLSEYMKQTKSQYLFGCSSVFSTDPHEVSALIALLKKQGYYSSKFNIDAQMDFFMEIDQGLEVNDETQQLAKAIFPGLLKTYLMAGAKVHGFPAHDKDFQCVDLLTIMHIDDLRPSYRKRYFSWADS